MAAHLHSGGGEPWAAEQAEREEQCSPHAEVSRPYSHGCKSYLYAVAADTGEPRWRIKTAEDIWGAVSSIAVDGSTVYFGTENGTFYASGTTRGELRWKYRTQSGGAEWTDPPRVTDGVVYGSVKNPPPRRAPAAHTRSTLPPANGCGPTERRTRPRRSPHPA
ncbi:outer membrane protein assembly factor BamB family protein [Streptomyces lydicus]|uniref:outer membrane protein assembly factor BamB family protein n=1 Tax=Streptomyces lydicus TaxID=47763 RepID=UPI0036EF8BE8